MCGIVGYIGANSIDSILLDGLKELEYRGYDSSGIAVMQAEGIQAFKAVGKLENLRRKIADYEPQGFAAGIGHTRWATHGKPTELNAHPHRLSHSYVVHNGIIENYQEIKTSLTTECLSQTDSEVIVHLFEANLEKANDPLIAFQQTIHALQGAYAILLISERVPDRIFFAKKGSPLQIGFSTEGCFFASSDASLIEHCTESLYLEDEHLGYATEQELILCDAEGETVEPVYKAMASSCFSAQKEGYRFFIEKEIYEQTQILSNSLMGRLDDDGVKFEEINPEWLLGFSSVTICACGTSYHAAMVASYLLERLAKIPTNITIASEFRYREPILDKKSLFVVISQSGETADTLETLKLVKSQDVSVLAFCNVDNSSIVREADVFVLLRAGIEKSVASTKAFSAQVMALWLFATYWGQLRNTFSDESLEREIHAIRHTHQAVKVNTAMHERIHRLSKRCLHGHGFFFIGRDIFFPLALEGALKLKEISYLHAEGYPAGEMKHGPIALADAELFTIALMGKSLLYDKIKSNVEELSARDATIIAITSEPFELADDIIQINSHDHPMLEFFEMLVAVQLLAMEVAIRLGHDVDMPRNLAKSVTVE